MDPTAIIGIGCRFPSAGNPESFWDLLQHGVHTITEVPSNRWDVDALYDPDPATPGKMNTRWGAFLEQIDMFEPSFFGISPREAESMDPQHRLVLEVAWEALENAGVAPNKLADSQTGVFIGIVASDYGRLVFNDPLNIDAYGGIGITPGIAANRLSYILNLHGPSLAIDTACSSSLVALHFACQSLQSGESNLCLVGGVNLVLSPEYTLTFSQARMMASDGFCKTFDKDADGYVRGEGCGVIVLKRLCDALRDRDNVLAVIKGSAVNHDGLSNGMTAPNGLSQQAVIRQALKNAGVAPAQISYVEAHGTGTSLGDPIEVESIKAVLGQGRSPLESCGIGSIKTNIGHLEAAAGIVGLIKTVLSLQHQQIPSHLHLKQLNPLIQLEGTPFFIPTECQPWSVAKEPRLAGVSSFSFGGTNCHVILSEAPKQETRANEIERPAHILALSAKNQKALSELVERYEAHLKSNSSAKLADVCFTANTGRTHFDHRLFVTATSTTEMQKALRDLAEGKDTVPTGQICSPKRQKIAFLFTGQGSVYVNMGRQLYDTQPTFRNCLKRCEEILRPYLEVPLLSVLYPDIDLSSPTSGEANQKLYNTAYTQPALFALEYALCQLWKSWGIEADAVIGHSVGEYVAACVAGVFSLEDGLKLIAMRGQLMQQLPPGGEMLSLLASESQVREVIAPYGEQVAIAALNGPSSIVISGKSEAIQEIYSKVSTQGIKAKFLQVSHAFHSPLMEPMLGQFEVAAWQISYHKPQIPLISNVTGQLIGDDTSTPEYWVNHIRQPVRFADGMQTLYQEGCQIFLEIGPQAILLGMGRQCLPEDRGVWLPSLRKDREDWQQLLESLGELYVRGLEVDWSGLDKDYTREKVVLPTYPFQRERYWTKATNFTNFVDQEEFQDWLYEVEWQPQASFGGQFPSEELLDPLTINQKLQPLVSSLASVNNLDSYSQLVRQLETLSVEYVLQAFDEMGWSLKLGENFSTESLAQKLGVVPQYQQLFNLLLEMLAEVEILRHTENQWVTLQTPEKVNLQQKNQTLLAQFPSANAELTMLERCGSQLRAVLQGTIDPLQVLFPEGDFTIATQLYEQSPEAQFTNTLVQRAIATALENLPPSRGVRLLEIGAGTGGTTSYILPHLNPEQTEYIFTDIGTSFTSKAQERFQDYPFIHYQNLDIEKNPELQGFEPHQYDVIVAANVIHATSSLRKTLQHVRQLLKPGGMFVLLEITTPRRWVTLSFGMLEGWWKFSDFDLRPNQPLLSPSKWQQLLVESGFPKVVNLPDVRGTEEVLSSRSLIIAQTAVTPSLSPSEGWLIFADRQGIAQQLADRLRTFGQVCNLVFPGKEYQQIASDEFTINPENSDDYLKLVTEVKANLPDCKGVFHLWSLDTPRAEELTPEGLKVASKEGCGSALYLVQALTKAQFLQSPRLWLVTKGAQPVLPIKDSISGLAQSPLWGMGRVISLEHPELSVRMLDLDPNVAPEHSCTTLLTEIGDANDENHIVFRDAQRYVARLINKKFKESQSFQFRPDATYLITGGTGFLGLKLAQWMVEQGACQLVLIGRKGLPQREDWPNLDRESNEWKQVQAIQLMEEKGARVTVYASDVTDQAQMSSIIKGIDTAQKPLRGIIHAAGLSGEHKLSQMNYKVFESLLSPKTIGTWVLHQLTKEISLDFFICFSSIASVWGSLGHGHYDAANHFLNILASYRRSIGLPALSINWGIFVVGGMIADENYVRWMNQIGIEALQPEEGFNALKFLLKTNAIQPLVTKVDWSTFKEYYEVRGLGKLFSDLMTVSTVDQTTPSIETIKSQESSILEQLKAASPSKIENILLTHFQNEIAKSLRTSASEISLQKPLNSMGLDSLMAVELRNMSLVKLGIDIPTVKFIEGLSIADIVTEVKDQLNQIDASQKVEWKNSQQLYTEEPDQIERVRGEL
ncbi:type I polyketide synthase [Moorena producens JHB]|uniref:Type I polyketide synthase n=2 Tax=Cyanophyceae TaxID=3028117 RepID=A0A1D9FY31_MOOP1|nr:type I polyketide synthase [Moorena producens]AAY42396.1 HctD [Lyngbya majuscula]AOY80184.1 type I polyketide synthase [Moorena producens JHB]